MGSSHDHIALDWVRGEIEQTLTLARNALELYANDRDEPTQVGFCLNHLHQVQGTLKMVELYGVAQVAQKMEELCLALRDSQVQSFEEALEALMASILRLQNYIESATEALEDVPKALIPVLNDLKAAHGEALVTGSIGADVSRNKVSGDPALNKRMQDAKVAENLRKLRQRFQSSLANIIRNQNSEEHLQFLAKVIERLEKFCKGSPLGQLWWVAYGFVEALERAEQPLGSAVKQLLRELDFQLKGMIDQPDDALSREVSQDLIENLLFYVAAADYRTERIDALAEAYGLSAGAGADADSIIGPDKSTLGAIASALIEELNTFKDRLDLIERNDDATFDLIRELIPGLQTMQSSIAVVGIEGAQKELAEQIAELQTIDGDEISPELLMSLADTILSVEAQVQQLTSGPDAKGGAFGVPAEQFENAHLAVIEASKGSLESAKNSIVGYITSNWDVKQIEGVPAVLESIRGGLQIIPLKEASELVAACGKYIQEQLLDAGAKPDWSNLDRLADAISSIEYYIERLNKGSNGDTRFLDVARESLHKLGYWGEGDQEPTTEHISRHHVSEAASEAPDAVAKETDEQLIDQEILEIFAEEVEEVADEIRAATRALQANESDFASLAELRRAFHTLKGSGKLVGANDIASLAWSIEDRLNQRIDQSRPLLVSELGIVQDVCESLSALLESFSTGSPSELSADLERRVVSAFDGIELSSSSTEVLDTEEPAVFVETAESDVAIEQAAPVEESSQQLEAAPEAVDEQDDDDLIDEEILEIFVEEAEEVNETIQEYLPRFVENYDDNEALVELRRAFHTLKGSGRMVEAMDIGETAWAIENLLNRVIDKTIEMQPSIAELAVFVAQNIPALVENFKTRSAPVLNPLEIEAKAQQLISGEEITLSDLGLGTIDSPDSQGESLPTNETEVTAEASDTDAVSEDDVQGDSLEDSLIEIFEIEAIQHIETVEEFVNVVLGGEELPVNDALSRALHTDRKSVV